jgi:N-dimethylarginine dimethylaminohydrolase
MPQTHSAARPDPARRTRTYLMCPPEHFAVDYAINPWMNPAVPVDSARAMSQRQQLHAVLARLGHTVHVIDPRPGLPDMSSRPTAVL